MEIFNAIKLDLTKEVINEVQIIENDDDMLERKNIVQADLEKINRIHACHLLNKKPFANMKSLGLVFNEMQYNTSVELKLEDQGLRLQREPPPMNHFYSSGERMKLVSKGMFRYIVKIRERVFIEGDPGQTCRNYPNTEFASYSECDDQYVRKRVEEIAPGLNLTPIWISDHLDTVTSEPLPTNLSLLGKDYFPLQKTFFSVHLDKLFFGVDPSNCPLPCSTFSAEIKLLQMVESPKSNMILDFLPIIEVMVISSKSLFWADFCQWCSGD